MKTLLSERHREILTLLGLLSCGFALVSLAGWHAGDPTPLNPGTGRVENYCGPIGATIADGLFALLGYGAWAIVLPMAAGFWSLARRELLGWPRLIAGLGLYLTALAVGQIALRPGGAFSPGGVVGRALVTLLETSTGTVGALFVLGAVALLCGTIAFRLDWRSISERLVDHLEVWVPYLLHGLVEGVKRGARGAGRGAQLSGGAAVTATRWSGGAVISAVTGAFGRVWGVVRRMFASFVRSEHDGPDVDWATASELDEFTGGPDSLPPSQVDDPTQVGGPAILAEVEWDPTTMGPASDEQMQPAYASVGGGMASLPVSTGPGTFGAASSPSYSPPPVALAAPVARPTLEPEPSADFEIERTPARAQPIAASQRAPEPVEAVEAEPMPRIEIHTGTPKAARTKKKAKAEESAQEPMFDKVEIDKAPYLDLRHSDDGKAAVTETDAFKLPPLALLDEVPEQHAVVDELELQGLALTIEEKLKTFKVGGRVVGVRPGPVVTIFEFLPNPGVRVGKVAGLADDLMMALKAVSLRIVAPIPGKDVVGIEVPSDTRLTIYFRELMASPIVRRGDLALPCVLGKDVESKPLIADLAKMPHLLIGGSTGSGKSVGVNGMLMSMLMSKSPDDLRMILIDPKMLEFQLYADIPHLLHPVITDPSKAAGALAWACIEMDRRYDLIARWEVRNLKSYNAKVMKESKDWTDKKARYYAPKGLAEYETPPGPEKLPFIVVVIDELADLMMTAKKDVEGHISRLAAKARACGIHLIIATQRPSVDVLTGVIKANLPTRIAYRLQNGHDSKTILNSLGAEKLLGMGDMLFIPPGASDSVRGHGPFVSDGEVKRICDFLRAQREPDFIDVTAPSGENDVGEERHPKYREAVEFVVRKRKASTSMVQRALGIGYNKAADIIDCMEADGFVGPADGSRPRKVLLEEVPSWL